MRVFAASVFAVAALAIGLEGGPIDQKPSTFRDRTDLSFEAKRNIHHVADAIFEAKDAVRDALGELDKIG